MNRKFGVILSYILTILEAFSSMILIPFIIRTVGPGEYGVYKLIVSINSYLLILDLGIGNAVVRFISKYRANNDKENESKFIGISNLFYFFISFVAVACGIVLILVFPTVFSTGLSNKEIILGQKLLGLIMINTFLTLSTTTYTNMLIAYEKFSVSKIASIIQITLKIVFSFAVLKCGLGSIGLVFVSVILTFCVRSFFIFYSHKVLKIKACYRGFKKQQIIEIIGFSSLILLQMIATQMNASIDQILIGSLVPASSVLLAIYSVGSQMNYYFQQVGGVYTTILFPGIVKSVEQGACDEKIAAEMIRYGRIIFMTLFVIYIGFIVVGRDFLTIWAGSGYEDAYIVSVLLMTANLLALTEVVGGQFLWARNQHKEQAILKFAIVACNIFLTITLIYWRPLIGATIGTFVSLMLGDVVVMAIIYRKKLHLNLIRYFGGIARGIVVSGMISGIIAYFVRKGLGGINIYIRTFVPIIVLIIIYAICMLIFGFNNYEKDVVKSVLIKITKKGSKKL